MSSQSSSRSAEAAISNPPSPGPCLNIAPLSFSDDCFRAGRQPYTDEETYRALRERHRASHVFRFDVRDGMIWNVAVVPDAVPLGETQVARVDEHLLLLGKVVQHLLLEWLRATRTILRPVRPLQCWGNRRAALLSAAIRECNLEPVEGLDVLVRHSFDTRVLQTRGAAAPAFLALLLDVDTSNELAISVDALIDARFDLIGRWVCRHAPIEDGMRPRLETLGRVIGLESGILRLADPSGDDSVAAKHVLLEPRQEYLEALVHHQYDRAAHRIMTSLAKRRRDYWSGAQKLDHIRRTLEGVRDKFAKDLHLPDGLVIHVGTLLGAGDPLFPDTIETSRPTFLFGAQGSQTNRSPDAGVKTFGPYKYMQHARNAPLVAVICERGKEGSADELARALRDGFPDDVWREIVSGRPNPKVNPFQGGLVGKFRLARVQFAFEAAADSSVDAYEKAIQRYAKAAPGIAGNWTETACMIDPTARVPVLPATRLLLFGATGDLAQRMLLPSLFSLHAEGLVAPELKIIGTARSKLDDAAFRAAAAKALDTHLAPDARKPEAVASFLERLSYVPLDASDPDSFAALTQPVGADRDMPIAIYLSTAPSLFGPTIEGLRRAGLDGPNVRIGLEKPLGHDLASSAEINDAVAAAYPEGRTFRIDHYLGKETVQNLLALRFGNRLFEPLWNAEGVEHVQITVSETVGLEGRVSYYDGVGALRDMLQNHMLQLFALVAMEPPSTFGPAAVRDEKVKVLRSLRPIDRATAASHSVTGQYGAGAVGGQAVPGYADELGRASDTETFVAVKAHVDNWRWHGVPFYLRTGKRLPNRHSEIYIQFREVPHSIFSGRGGVLQSNKLVIRLQPEESIRMLVMAKEPGLGRDGIKLREVPLDLSLTSAFAGFRRRIAYERLLLDLIEGDPTLFVRRDEVEAQWEWIDAIRDGWKAANVTPRAYAAGTWGPSAAIALTERDGVHWHD